VLSCKVVVGGSNRSDELVNFFGVFDAFEGASPRRINFDPRADVKRQRAAAWTQLGYAVAHVCRVESTTQDEVSVDVWRKK
jgi:hypothetical protein